MKLVLLALTVALAGCGGSPVAPSPMPSPPPAPSPTPQPQPPPGPTFPASPSCTASRLPGPSDTIRTQNNILPIGPAQNFTRNPAHGPTRATGVWRFSVTWQRAEAPIAVTIRVQGGAVIGTGIQTAETKAELCWDSTDGDLRYEATLTQANQAITQDLDVLWTFPTPN